MDDTPLPDFPPRMTGVKCPDGETPFEHACKQAAAGVLGAGDVVWSDKEHVANAAFVLEPDVPLAAALQIWPTAMVAVADMLGALSPPQIAVMFRFPGTVLVNGAAAGHTRVASASGDGNAVPDWLVVELYLRLMFDGSGQEQAYEPGNSPEITSLAEEGCGELTRSQLISSFARHFMTWIYDWGEDGFKPVADSWKFRADDGVNNDREGGTMSLTWQGQDYTGTFLGLDENGNLLLKPENGDALALNLIDDIQVFASETVQDAS